MPLTTYRITKKENRTMITKQQLNNGGKDFVAFIPFFVWLIFLVYAVVDGVCS